MSKTADSAFLSALNTGHPGIVTSSSHAGVAEGIPPREKDVTVSHIRARNASCDCPHCGAESDGWLADPRGRETECDGCGLPFSIAPDATVSIT